MTVSNKALCASALAAVLTVSLTAPVRAQDAAPAGPEAPAAAAPAPPEGASDQVAPAPSQIPGQAVGNVPISILPEPDPNAPPEPAPDTSIDTVELAAPGIDRLGLVSTGKGGFAPELWAGTDPDFLKQMLPLFPARIVSPAERRLAQNLLLSPGAPPDGSPAEMPSDSPNPSDTANAAAPAPSGEGLDAAGLLLARVQNLMAMGDWTDVAALIELVPADQMTEALRRIYADAELAGDHLDAACAAAQAALQSSSDVYWQELQVFCQITTEQATAASLGLDVLREQKLDDPGFFWAVETLQGGRKPAPAAVTSLSPMLYAVIRKAGVALPPALAKMSEDGMPPGTLSMVARIPTADEGLPGDKPVTDPARRERQKKAIEGRIVLAEHAVAAGSLDPEYLRDLYKGFDLKQDTDLPLLTKVAPDDIRGRVLLFQSALLQTVPTARAEVITRAVELARLDGGEKGPDLTVVGRAYAAMLSEMEVSGEMVWFAGTAARALLAAGEREKAKAWLDLVHNMSRNSLEAGVVADNLWPLERLLSPAQGDMPPGAVRTWAASVPEVVRDAQRQTLYGLFVAVGESVSPGAFGLGLGDSPEQDIPNVRPAVWNGLTAAARGKRVGETAALSLIALGGDGPARAAPATLQKVIESLMAVGRAADARSLALEAALIKGL